MGSNPLKLTVKNIMIIRRDERTYIRVEFRTKFDFSKVQEILTSQEIKHPTD